jgi:aspartate carbamoyltransferase catalytic subunit
MAGDLLDDPSRSLVDEQVRNGVPIRMALLYLLAAALPDETGLRALSLKEA